MVSGTQISFWVDAWAGQPLSLHQTGPMPRRSISLLDAKYLFHSLIPGPLTIHQSLASDILRSFLPSPGLDKTVWQLSPSGEFSVSSIYNILTQAGKTTSRISSIWKAKVTPSMRLTFFLLLNNKLLTHDVMERRNLTHTPGCVMCAQRPPETATHLFFLCPYSATIWNAISTTLGSTVLSVQETPQLTFLASIPAATASRPMWMVYFITVTSLIWKERNARTFPGNSTPSFILAAKALHDATLYLKHCT